jgi:hypothetical protein
MRLRERWLLWRYLRDCRFFLEFGAGGSTVVALDFGVPRIISIESDPAWVEKLKEHPAIYEGISAGRLSLRYVNIGEVKEWGRPANPADNAKWPAYYEGIWSELKQTPDVILVDGGFRVECARAAARNISSSTVLLMHDYWSRPSYHKIENDFECIESVGDLAVFRKRAATAVAA